MKLFTVSALLLSVAVLPAVAQQRPLERVQPGQPQASQLQASQLQQRQQQVSFKVPEMRYTTSQSVQVGDEPNHMLRMFASEGRVAEPSASIDGLKIVEVQSRGNGELTQNHGGGSGYMVFIADNGDKIFSRNNIVAHSVGGKPTSIWSGQITGGTGRLAGIQGVVHYTGNFDPNPGGQITNSQFDIEYTMGSPESPASQRPR